MNTLSHVSIVVKAVRKALTLLKSVVWTKHHKAILTTVQLRKDQGGLWLCASDFEKTARILLDYTERAATPEAVNLEHKRLSDAIKSTKSDRIQVSEDQGKTRLSIGTTSVVLESHDASEYMPIPRFEAKSWIRFDGPELVRAIDRTLPFTDAESTRYALGSLLIESETNSIKIVASDGRRLAIQSVSSFWSMLGDETESLRQHEFKTMDVKVEPTTTNPTPTPVQSQSCLLHGSAAALLRDMIKAAPKGAAVDMAWSPESEGFAIRIEDFAELTVRNVEGRFPRYQDVLDEIPYSTDDTAFTLDSAETLEIIRACQSTESESHSLCLVAIPQGAGDVGVHIHATEDDKTSRFENRQRWVSVSGPMRDTWLSSAFMVDMLKAINATSGKLKTSGVDVFIKDRSKAVTFRVGGDYKHVIMPLTLDKDQTPEQRRDALSISGRKIYNRIHGIPEPLSDVVAIEPEPIVEPVALDPQPEPIIPEPEPEPIVVVEPVAVAVAVPAPVRRKESKEESKARTRREERDILRSDPAQYANELAYARKLLAERRKEVYGGLVCEMKGWIRDLCEDIRSSESRLHNYNRIKRTSLTESEYVDVKWAEIRKIRKQWHSLPQNRKRLAEQRERQPIRHRAKFVLFGFETPNERPYVPTPRPEFSEPATITPVQVFPTFVALAMVDATIETVFSTNPPTDLLSGFADGWSNNPFMGRSDWDDATGYGNGYVAGQLAWAALTVDHPFGFATNWTYALSDVETPIVVSPPTEPTPVEVFEPTPRPEFSGDSPVAKVKPKVDATPSALTITVKGVGYGLELLGNGSYRLASPKGDVYDVYPCGDLAKANQGYACDCPDHAKRHAGLGTKGCKHANALRSVGLISAPTLPTSPDDYRQLADEMENAMGRAESSEDYDMLHKEVRSAIETAFDMEDQAERARLEAAYPLPTLDTPSRGFLDVAAMPTLPPVCGGSTRKATPSRRAIEGMPYGSTVQNDAADAWWNRLNRWMDVRFERDDYIPEYAETARRKLMFHDVWYLAQQRYLYAKDQKASDTPAGVFLGSAALETLPPVCGGAYEDETLDPEGFREELGQNVATVEEPQPPAGVFRGDTEDERAERREAYKARKEARIDRLREKAEKARERSQSAYARSSAIADAIPFGQPILVGHHSEKGHRRDIAKIHSAMDKSCEESAKAKYYEQKAEAAEDNDAIYSDDPDAIDKLKEKLAVMQERHKRMVSFNKQLRAGKLMEDLDLTRGERLNLESVGRHQAYYCKDIKAGVIFPPYALQNSNGNMKRVKERIADLEKRAERPPVESIESNGIRMEHNAERDSLELYFPGKPEASVIANLKGNGWKWARGSACWYKRRSNASEAFGRSIVAAN